VSLISLELFKSAFNEPTEEQLRKRLSDATKARNLLENRDFLWWIETRKKGVENQYKKLVYRDDGPAKYHERRGVIKGIEKDIDELRILASAVEDIEAKLKERYDRQQEPVARGA
jgi:hypothetical protein